VSILDQYEFDREPSYTSSVTRDQGPLAALLIAVVVLLAAGAFWFFFMRPEPQQQPVVAAAAKPATPPPAPAGITPLCTADGADAPVPPLDDSDAFTKKAASAVSAHPRLAAWLATDDIVRNFVVAVDNVASGATPAPRMRALRPTGTFRVREARGETYIDPRSFERYAPIADAIESIDARSAADLCGMLKPRLVEAYAELGRDGSFDVALERAIVALLRTPPIGPDTRLVPHGASYAFEDDTLEHLTPAQKQLARMGPRNSRVIQDKLRQVAIAIGIPEDRLPAN
jgi:hypothetical protein